MNPEKKLEEQFREFKDLAKEDKNIDAASLMINALENQPKNAVAQKKKTRAYLVSLLLPPFGLLYALKYYLSAESDATQIANVCVILTAIAFLILWLTVRMMLAGSGINLEQIQQINPSDIQQLLQ